MDQPTERPQRARGFALYVGLDETQAEKDGLSLAELVRALKAELQKQAPSAASHASIALAPEGTPGDDLEIVRLALHDPATLQALRPQHTPREEGVVIDISRKRLSIAGTVVQLSYSEFRLLQFLVLREGQDVERAAIIDHLWDPDDDSVPNERTIDVYIRRLRGKLEPYPDIVQTIRGTGYRFDRHPDVSIIYGQGPSPDVGV